MNGAVTNAMGMSKPATFLGCTKPNNTTAFSLQLFHNKKDAPARRFGVNAPTPTQAHRNESIFV
jgi:hypothetical protein